MTKAPQPALAAVALGLATIALWLASCAESDVAKPREDELLPGGKAAASGAAIPPELGPSVAPDAVIVFVRDVESYWEDCGCSGDVVGGVARLPSMALDSNRATYVFTGRTILPPEQALDSVPRERRNEEIARAVAEAAHVFRALGTVVYWQDAGEAAALKASGTRTEDINQYLLGAKMALTGMASFCHAKTITLQSAILASLQSYRKQGTEDAAHWFWLVGDRRMIT